MYNYCRGKFAWHSIKRKYVTIFAFRYASDHENRSASINARTFRNLSCPTTKCPFAACAVRTESYSSLVKYVMIPQVSRTLSNDEQDTLNEINDN